MAEMYFTTKAVHGILERKGIFDVIPDRCPLCHHNINAVALTQVPRTHSAAEFTDGVTGVFLCPRNACQEVFLARYEDTGRAHPTHGSNIYQLGDCRPLSPSPVVISPEVAHLSPMFVEVYTQALESEGYGLDQLTGIGLRKALEFLIKDFVIHELPDKKESVEKTLLGPCIENFVTDQNIKNCANRATWLGNDETHYVRKWTDKDVKDLKILIRLTMLWVEGNLLTKKYVTEMQKK